MRRIRTVGLALTAVFVLGAMAASAASALPEYVNEAGKNPKSVKFTGAAGPSKLISATGVTIECQADTSSGTIKGASLAEKIKITYTGCKLPAAALECATNAKKAKETITTESLKGTLVYAAKEVGTEKTAGELFEPETAGGAFAEFKCGSETIVVTGKIIGKVEPINEPPSKKGKVVLAEQLTQPEVGCGKQGLLYVNGVTPCDHLTALGVASWNVATENLEFITEALEIKA